MFDGEMASLTAILKTGTVKVPKPIKVLDAPGGGSMLVMEHLDMHHLSRSVSPRPFWLKAKALFLPLCGSLILKSCIGVGSSCGSIILESCIGVGGKILRRGIKSP